MKNSLKELQRRYRRVEQITGLPVMPNLVLNVPLMRTTTGSRHQLKILTKDLVLPLRRLPPPLGSHRLRGRNPKSLHHTCHRTMPLCATLEYGFPQRQDANPVKLKGTSLGSGSTKLLVLKEY